MRYERMRPAAIRRAIAEGWPVAWPVGVLEYHAGHLPLGVDGLVVEGVLERLAAVHDLVLLPTFWWAAASHAVAGPEGTGTVHVDAEAVVPVARQALAALLRVGFRNIHVVIHHQTEAFAQGMPSDLAFRLAARQAVFAHLERERGEGWWGRPEASGYYAEHAAGADPFAWVRVHPLLDAEAIRAFPFDHAGQGETSLMMALAPDTVAEPEPGGPWYAQSAARASAALGEEGVALALAHLRRAMGLG
jgi:creatinine amidohydrolase/Fe(II)-dependent formamide hydrolase-like protein